MLSLPFCYVQEYHTDNTVHFSLSMLPNKVAQAEQLRVGIFFNGWNHWAFGTWVKQKPQAKHLLCPNPKKMGFMLHNHAIDQVRKITHEKKTELVVNCKKFSENFILFFVVSVCRCQFYSFVSIHTWNLATAYLRTLFFFQNALHLTYLWEHDTISSL